MEKPTASPRPERGDHGVDPFTRTVVRASDGVPLVACCAGAETSPTLVFANALGMRVEVLAPLARALAAEYRFITWECRISPGTTGEGATGVVEAHLDDLTCVLSAFGVQTIAVLAGWCTGVRVAAHFAGTETHRVQSLALFNGSYRFPEARYHTPYETLVRAVLDRVLARPHYADLFVRLSQPQAGRPGAGGSAQRFDEMLGIRDEQLLELARDAFRDPLALRGYARAVAALDVEVPRALLSRIDMPALVSSGGCDRVSSPEASRVASALLPRGELDFDDEGDHYAIYAGEATARRICAFLERHGLRAAPARSVKPSAASPGAGSV